MLLIAKTASRYPRLLKEIHRPPALYYEGDLPKSDDICVAIVGTRKATASGLAIARQFAERLASSGIAIVSGLAMGIDTAAHEGALAANGKTIAVLGRGLDRIYPAQNAGLAKKIIEAGGALISEYPPEEPTYPGNFIARNRIISGLSHGVIVVEAPEESGALATANFALEQNREVFVVPGPANQENYIGSHKLIRAGARLTANPEEVIEDLGFNFAQTSRQPSLELLNLDAKQKQIFDALKTMGEPVSVDKIQEISKMDVSAVNRNLTFLLIQGIVKEDAGLYRVNHEL